MTWTMVAQISVLMLMATLCIALIRGAETGRRNDASTDRGSKAEQPR